MLCEVCIEPSGSVGRCKICGRHVCGKHLSKDVCVVCETTLCEVCGTRLSVGSCAVCGRLACRACSVRIGAQIVCKKCFRKGV